MKEYKIKLDREGKETVQLSAYVSKELKEFLDSDAKRCQVSMRQYIERLIEKRRKEAPPFVDYTL